MKKMKAKQNHFVGVWHRRKHRGAQNYQHYGESLFFCFAEDSSSSLLKYLKAENI